MKSLAEIKSILAKHKQMLINKYGLKFIAIFGSYGRQQQQETSDIDLMVEFEKPIGIEFIDLADELEKLLNIRVDLVSKNGIKAKYLKQIQQDISYV